MHIPTFFVMLFLPYLMTTSVNLFLYTAFTVIMQLSFFEFFCFFENRLSYPFYSHLPWYFIRYKKSYADDIFEKYNFMKEIPENRCLMILCKFNCI